MPQDMKNYYLYREIDLDKHIIVYFDVCKRSSHTITNSHYVLDKGNTIQWKWTVPMMFHTMASARQYHKEGMKTFVDRHVGIFTIRDYIDPQNAVMYKLKGQVPAEFIQVNNMGEFYEKCVEFMLDDVERNFLLTWFPQSGS